MTTDRSFLVFGTPQIEEAEIAEVEVVLPSGWPRTGPRVAQFEQDFALSKNVDARQVAAVNSCAAVLHASMVAAELDAGAEVITPPLTFCATGNSILHAELTTVLGDVDPLPEHRPGRHRRGNHPPDKID